MSARPARLVAASLSLLALTGACSSQGTPGVKTEALQADIVFGVDIPEAEEVSVSPVDIPVGDVSEAPVGLTTLLVPKPFQNRIPARFRDVPFTISPETAAASACPTAPLGSAPGELAGDTATKPPVAGLYRYKISGTRSFTYANGVTMKTTVSGFQPRVVRNVEVTGKKWTYETVQPAGDGGVVVTTWSVNNEPTQRNVNPPYVGENPIRVSEPDGGLSITRIDYFDGNGNPTTTFDPISPVTYLQMPVLEGQEFNSVGIDVRGGTQQVTGQALKRQSVDACGTLVDGWLVSLDIAEARGVDAQQPRHEEIVVSTPLGALITSQRVVQSAVAPDGTRVEDDITFSIAQLEPDPLPVAAA